MNRLSRSTLALAVLASALPAIAIAAPRKFDHSEASERLREADANHDGVVTRAELLTYRAKQWQRFDRNGDGYFSQGDLPSFLADRWNGGRIAQMRDAFDANHDGRISRAEFVNGPTPGFDMADANHDGRVTQAELDAATAAVRKARS